MQVNSLGLTEAQPENNVQRIVLEALGVTLSKDARARSLQLPAWNEALGLPRPWDQQWSLRIQQVLAFETDLLEYDDIFDGSHVIEAKTAELVEAAQAELDEVLALGGAFEAIDELKGRLVVVQHRAHAPHRVGRARWSSASTPSPRPPTSPLGGDENILKVDPAVQDELIADVQAWRSNRDNDAVKRSLDELRRVAETGENIMPATIDLAHAGGTTGEWAGVLREVFGEYRAPTGVAAAAGLGGMSATLRDDRRAGEGPGRRPAPAPGGQARPRRPLQRRRADRRGGPRRRHGGHLPGHPPDARADRGGGPRRGRRRDRPVDPVGQPPRAGPRGAAPGPRGRASTPRSSSAASSPTTTGPRLRSAGVAAVYTPKDFELGQIMADIVDLAVAHRSA